MVSVSNAVLYELEMWCNELKLSEFQIKQVKYNYAKLLELGLTQGRSVKRVLCSIVFSLSKKHEWGFNMTKISRTLGENRTKLFRTYKGLKKKTRILN